MQAVLFDVDGVVVDSERYWVPIEEERIFPLVDGPGKPDPGVYEHAADRLGVPPSAYVAVEDSTHGVESATRAGMACVGYRTGRNREADLSAADAVADGPDALRAELLG